MPCAPSEPRGLVNACLPGAASSAPADRRRDLDSVAGQPDARGQRDAGDGAEESSSAMRANPSPGAVRAAVRSLLPTIRSRAVACERARSVPDETVEELRQTGLYQLVQPAAYGGYEQDFVVLADLMMDMAGACASTAWVCGLLSAHQWLVGLFPAEAQHDVWGEQPRCHAVRIVRSHQRGGGERRLSTERPLVLCQRLRQFPVGDLRGALAGDERASEPAGVPAGPGKRLRDRRHLGRHRPCRHGK